MNEKKRTALEKLDSLTDALVEEILSTPEDEILAEATEDLDDVDAAVEHVRGIITEAVSSAGKAKMQAAREAYEAIADIGTRGNVFQMSHAKKLAFLARLTASDNTVGEIMTLAARKGQNATERDTDAILAALIDLGVIDDEGEIR